MHTTPDTSPADTLLARWRALLPDDLTAEDAVDGLWADPLARAAIQALRRDAPGKPDPRAAGRMFSRIGLRRRLSGPRVLWSPYYRWEQVGRHGPGLAERWPEVVPHEATSASALDLLWDDPSAREAIRRMRGLYDRPGPVSFGVLLSRQAWMTSRRINGRTLWRCLGPATEELAETTLATEPGADEPAELRVLEARWRALLPRTSTASSALKVLWDDPEAQDAICELCQSGATNPGPIAFGHMLMALCGGWLSHRRRDSMMYYTLEAS